MCMSPESIIGSIVNDVLELLSEGKENSDSVWISIVHFIKQLWRDNEALSLMMATSLSTKLFTQMKPKIAVSTFSTIINLIGFSAPYWELLAHTVLAAANLKIRQFLSSTDLSSLSDLTMYCKVLLSNYYNLSNATFLGYPAQMYIEQAHFSSNWCT